MNKEEDERLYWDPVNVKIREEYEEKRLKVWREMEEFLDQVARDLIKQFNLNDLVKGQRAGIYTYIDPHRVYDIINHRLRRYGFVGAVHHTEFDNARGCVCTYIVVMSIRN